LAIQVAVHVLKGFRQILAVVTLKRIHELRRLQEVAEHATDGLSQRRRVQRSGLGEGLVQIAQRAGIAAQVAVQHFLGGGRLRLPACRALGAEPLEGLS
jgi:hypothetical protein